MRRAPYLASRVFNVPLAISADKAGIIANILINRMKAAPDAVPVHAGTYDDGADTSGPDVDGIAVIHITGTLVEKSSWLDAESGLIGYNAIESDLREAQANPRVKGILLVLNSHGGEVSGMFECARALSEVTKPVFASVNFMACSAAYLLAAQADRIYITESSIVGSIGVIAQHMEQSGLDAAVGLTYTTIYAGARKNDGNPHEPLSKGAKVAIQADVDDVHERFVLQVAEGRGIDAGAIRNTEAAVYRGEKGMEAGLADVMGSPAEAAAALADYVGNSGFAVAAIATKSKKEAEMRHRPLASQIAKGKTKLKQEKDELDELEEELEKLEDEEDADEDRTEEEKEEQEERRRTGKAKSLSGKEIEEICALCVNCNRKELAADFIMNRTPLASVRRALINSRAESMPRINSTIEASSGTRPAKRNTSSLEESPLVAEARRRVEAAMFDASDPKQNPLLADALRRAEAAKQGGH